MDTPSGSQGGLAQGPADQSDGAVIDAYLDTLLDGRAEDPAAFVARHPKIGPHARQRIHTLFASRQRAGMGDPDGNADGLPFERLGDFRLIRRLGEGGMGTVYLAEQESLHREVALKLTRRDLRGSPSAAERFEREAAAVARLRHPNIVTVHAFGEEGGVRYLALEYVAGRGLDEVIADAADAGAAVPAADAIRWAAEIARALDCAHAAGIVHRDVKPSNVRIAPDGHAKLLDFGIARDSEVDSITVTGPLVGSPLYAAPEQFAGGGDGIDGRTDVYGLGATLYESLAGRSVVERGTVDQVLHRKLHIDPVPVRRLRNGVSRDTQVVVMKALERDPGRRYASAREFAEDLEAVLAFQPIRARPPGPVALLIAWARRRPAVAGVAGTFLAAVLLAVVLLLVSAQSERRASARQARMLVRDARAEVDVFREARTRAVAVENRVQALRERLGDSYLTDEQTAELDAGEHEASGLRRERQEGLFRVLELLGRAQRLDPSVPGTDAVRIALWIEKWNEALTWSDLEGQDFYRRRLLALDPDAFERIGVHGSPRLSITTDPAGAEVSLYRYLDARELPGQIASRQVPVPATGAVPAGAGGWGLRVVQGAGDVPDGAFLAEIDGEVLTRDNVRELVARAQGGGAAALLAEGGETRRLVLPAGLSVRPTAAPEPSVPAARIGVTPIAEHGIDSGQDHLVLLRLEGYETVRVFSRSTVSGLAEMPVELLPVGSTPEGFVRVVAPEVDLLDFWIMEREVTVAEYLPFLNDARTLAQIAAAQHPIRYPRSADNAADGGFWRRDPAGLFVPDPDWKDDWPILGVSFDDAVAYAAWLTQQRRPPGDGVYALPTHHEWIVAGSTSRRRIYPWGERFRPRWTSSCHSRPQPNPTSVMTHPVDESAYGVFDMAGSAMEWCDGWWDESKGIRRLVGGAWGEGDPDLFKVWGGHGLRSDRSSGETGFRLVIRRGERR